MKYALYIMTVALLIGCGNIKTFTAQEDSAYKNLQDLVAAKNFEIIAHTARPMTSTALTQVLNSGILAPGNTVANINIIGTSNYLKVKGDTIQAYLPFFGEQFFGGNPGSNHQGISFNDIPEDYKVIMNDEKHSVDIHFKIEDEYRGNERYVVNITLFPNHTSDISVQSTERSNINFSGDVKVLAKDKKAR